MTKDPKLNKDSYKTFAKELVEATLGGDKYKGKENPNRNHTKNELGNAVGKHSTLAGKAMAKASAAVNRAGEAADERGLTRNSNIADKQFLKATKHDDARGTANLMRTKKMYVKKSAKNP